MSNTSTKTAIENLLKSDDRLWNESKTDLNQILLIDLVENNDEIILGLLIGNPETKAKFFLDINGIMVFKTKDFRFFMEENKVDNSYTIYKNKIGLTDGRKFLRDTPDVVLDFPFKDCVLEGGQTKDDSVRNEIFFNNVIAHDEIDRLLYPKAFAGYKRFTSDKAVNKVLDSKSKETETGSNNVGQYFHRNEQGTITDNLIIKGNNLIALHSLKTEFKSKVKLIYIDPPYNTGSDSFGYNDRFNHSTWLVFMKNRLEVARELLRDDGVIFVQCDDNEQAYLKVLMDEIFGRENYLNCVAVKMSTSAGLKMSNIETKLLKIKESIVIFTKKPGKFKLQNIDELYSNKAEYETERSDKYIENIEDPFEQWYFCSLHQAFQKYAKPKQEKFDFVNENCDRIFNHVINPSTKKAWGKLSEGDKIKLKDKVRSYGVAGSGYKYAFNDHVFIPYNPKILDGDMWVDNYSIGGTKSHEGGVEFNNGKKREVLLKRIINISTNQGDIILDYHLGSGTTAAVAHKMGRQYIGVEQMDYIQDISCVRMQKVLNGEQGGISKSVNWEGGGSFVYLELAKNNDNGKAEILACSTTKKLVALFDRLYNRYFLNYNLKIKNFAEKTLASEEFGSLNLDEQKKVFLEMLDLNQMYVHATEVEDKMFGVSKSDIDVTQEFYNIKDTE
jgi:adenine-specific DNA-methyltransferase